MCTVERLQDHSYDDLSEQERYRMMLIRVQQITSLASELRGEMFVKSLGLVEELKNSFKDGRAFEDEVPSTRVTHLATKYTPRTDPEMRRVIDQEW